MTETRPPEATPRPASTLVLLRDSPAGLEVLLTTRPKHLRFMGGAAVFPGGATAPADADPRWAARSALAPSAASELMGDSDPGTALGWFICALRETFEEVGLLLADGPAAEVARDDAEDAERFLARCESLGLTLRTDQLIPAGRWVTPLGAPVRFDARFFVAEAPAGWIPDPDPREVDRCWWTTPAEALTALASGSLLMAPPTVEMLQRLGGCGSIAEVRASLEDAPVGRQGNIISVRLSPLVHVVLAPNPGVMTGPGTNTYIVGQGPYCVIDPAVDDDEYLAAVRAAAPDIESIVVTHRHPDHTGGVAALSAGHIPVLAYGDEPITGVTPRAIDDGAILEVGRARLRVLHCPGHARDHLNLYMEGAASLFAGDNVLGEGTAVIAPPDGSMRDYLASLRRLRELHIDRIYPGHFRPLDGGTAVIDGYIRHREERRAAVVAALAAGATMIEEVVAEVYRDTPAHLHPVAAYQVMAMLELLQEDGEVVVFEDHWRVTHVE